MQPLTSSEYAELVATDDLDVRADFARAIGNHKVNTFRLKQAIHRTARRYLHAKGLSPAELERRAPLPAPPPGQRGLPTTGNIKVFALLIEFVDYTHTNSSADINALLFGNPSSGAPYESLAAYYRRASYDSLDLTGGTILGWYAVNKKRSDVAQTTAGREVLIKEALQHYKALGQDFKQFDNDGDGVIDYFMVFWTGPDTGWGSIWWGYQTTFHDSSFKLDGLSLSEYSWQWECRPVGTAFNPIVAIHETGHALGLPDLYDYPTSAAVGPKGGVGGADMMDANRYDHNCFSKWMLDWLAPRIVSSGSEMMTLSCSGTSRDCCVAIWPGMDSDDLFSEVFFVQNRQPVGNDSQLPKGGLIIWHVDARLDSSGKDFECSNSWTDHKLVRLMEADGREDIEALRGFDTSDLYTPGKSFGQTTNPNSARYDGVESGIEVHCISASGDQITITVRVQPWESLGGDFVADPCAIAWGADHNFLNVFVRGKDGAVWHKWWDGSSWGPSFTEWESLGGSTSGDPCAIAWGPSDQNNNVFVRGSDGAIWHRWSFGGGWSSWESLGGDFVADPCAIAWGADHNFLNVFVRGKDGAVWHKWWDGSSWGPSFTEWESLGGSTSGDPCAIAWGADHNLINLFVRGKDRAVWHKWWDGANWRPTFNEWESRVGILEAVAWGSNDNHLNVFARSTDGAIWHKWSFGGGRAP